jgi:hypothetical protein
MTRGEHGHPEEEGYGTTRVAETTVTDEPTTDTTPV